MDNKQQEQKEKEHERNVQIGKRMRLWRKNRHITQDDMAKCVGVANKSYISSIERGEHSISAQVIIAYSQVLNVSADMLLGLEKAFVHPELSNLIGTKLTEEGQKKLLALLYAYLES